MDRPFLEIETEARKVVDAGGIIFQTWTCGGCGKLVTGNKKNFLALTGHCEGCDHMTDLKDACGFVAFMEVK